MIATDRRALTRPSRRTHRRVVRAVLAVVLQACTGGQQGERTPTESGPAPRTLEVESIVIAPAETSIAAGSTVRLTATVAPVTATATPIWSSSDSSIVTVSGAGLVSAIAAGRATISAVAGAIAGTSIVVVTSPPPPPPPPPPDPVVIAAGDIASCLSTGDEATADLIDGIAGTVITLGDNVYDNGTLAEYTACYAPSWGRHKSRTRPAPGNHEYNTPNATGYFTYFGAAAGDPTKGYYSYDLGAWHIIVLNSNLGCTTISCALGSEQDAWLRADLAAHSNVCTLAYWHHPRFSSGAIHGDHPRSRTSGARSTRTAPTSSSTATSTSTSVSPRRRRPPSPIPRGESASSPSAPAVAASTPSAP